jgi:hypothetical protein
MFSALCYKGDISDVSCRQSVLRPSTILHSLLISHVAYFEAETVEFAARSYQFSRLDLFQYLKFGARADAIVQQVLNVLCLLMTDVIICIALLI